MDFKRILFWIGVLYIVSPFDFFAGPVDDIIVGLVMAYGYSKGLLRW